MAIKIITRHSALVQVLREDYGIVGDVIDHATPADVHGHDIVGILPIHLAALANSITMLNLNLPPSLRGVELTVEQVRQYMDHLKRYRVTEIID